MSVEQLAELESEKANLSPEDIACERMFMAFEIRFWRQKAWRTEQQRARITEEKRLLEEKYEKYKNIPEHYLDALINTIKEEKIESLKEEAKSIIEIIPWVKYDREAKEIPDLDEKIKFWTSLISYYKSMEHEDT